MFDLLFVVYFKMMSPTFLRQSIKVRKILEIGAGSTSTLACALLLGSAKPAQAGVPVLHGAASH